MKKFFINIFIFGFFAVLMYMILLMFAGNFMPGILTPNLNYKIGSYGHLYTRLKEVKERENIDILFLGSSHAYRGFDTSLFQKNGYSSFNLGSSSQTPIQTKILLKRYLKKLSPELIIYEVYPSVTLCSDGVESALDLIANGIIDKSVIKMAFKINHIKVYNTLIFSIIQKFLGINDNFTEPSERGSDKYIRGGYVKKKVSYYRPTKLPKKHLKIRKTQYNELKNILNLLKQKKIPFVLVYAPIPENNYNRFENHKKINHIFHQLGPYYNFNEMINLNDSKHFFDSHHLNQIGVEIFNKKLMNIIESNKMILY